jgi:hypothetical protein
MNVYEEYVYANDLTFAVNNAKSLAYSFLT